MEEDSAQGSEVPNGQARAIEPDTLLLRLFEAYEPLLGANLWPREEGRWEELVVCILTAAGKPEMDPDAIREVTGLWLGRIYWTSTRWPHTLGEWAVTRATGFWCPCPRYYERRASRPGKCRRR